MKRFWEIDFARGLAVVLMVIFNYSFALKFLGIFDLDLGWLYWWLFPRIIVTMFVAIAGLSVYLNHSQTKNPKQEISSKKRLSTRHGVISQS